MKPQSREFDIVDLLMQDATDFETMADKGDSPITAETASQLHRLIRIDILGAGWKDHETPGSATTLERHLREVSETLDLVKKEIAKRDAAMQQSPRLVVAA